MPELAEWDSFYVIVGSAAEYNTPEILRSLKAPWRKLESVMRNSYLREVADLADVDDTGEIVRCPVPFKWQRLATLDHSKALVV